MALTDNLISYWKLDEASGNALDAHGANTLTDVNTVGAAAGILNGARDFETNDNEVLTHVDNTDLSTGDIDFSFACWVKFESLTNYPVIANKGWGNSDANTEWILYYHSGSTVLKFSVCSGTSVTTVDSVVSITTGVWYHVAAYHDSVNNLIGIVVNAGTPDTIASSAGVNDGNLDFGLGGAVVQGLYHDGLLDEAGFWKKVLSGGDLTTLYGGGTPPAYPFSAGGPASLKTLNGTAAASVKTVNGAAIANVKTWNGIA